MKILVFFNNKGGVGKTTLVYHLAYMFSRMGVRTLAVDCDPQANLTSAFLGESELERIWPESGEGISIMAALRPFIEGTGDIGRAPIEEIDENLHLVCGDLELSRFEDDLSLQWPQCADGKLPAFRIESSFYRISKNAAESVNAELIIMDVGPNLGAINRAALLCADHIVMPLAADIYSLQGLRNLGPAIKRWGEEWSERTKIFQRKNPNANLPLPNGRMKPAGYVVMQPVMRLDRPVKAYGRWTKRIPHAFRTHIMQKNSSINEEPGDDPNCLAILRNYASLMPYALDARKPVFDLRPADGALGGHLEAVRRCKTEFTRLAKKIADVCGISVEAKD